MEIRTFETSYLNNLKKFNFCRFRVLLLGFWALYLLPFSLSAQIIKEKFDKLSISENFDSINTYWTTMASSENLFIVQDGEYILQRKSPTAPYAIIANLEESFVNFRVVTSIRIDKTMSEDAFAGFLFMMQPEGQGGFLVEINKNSEYRLRQIVNGSYKYITGTSKTGGWIKSSFLNAANFANMIEIRNFNKNYDLYINSSFVQTFGEPTYKSGKMGLIIGPGSRAKVDFMYVFTITSPEEINKAVASTDETIISPAVAAPDMIELAESIIKLKTQMNKLSEENEDLKKTISAMKSGDQEQDVTVKNYEKQIKSLQAESTKKENKIDSLSKVNTELMKYKEMAGGNENADLLIVLSKSIKAEKEKNAELERQLKELREKNGIAAPPPSKKPAKTNTEGNGQGDTIKKESNIFKLPE